MVERLQWQLNALHSLEQQLNDPVAPLGQSSLALGAAASSAARTMVGEVMDWRVIFEIVPCRRLRFAATQQVGIHRQDGIKRRDRPDRSFFFRKSLR